MLAVAGMIAFAPSIAAHAQATGSTKASPPAKAAGSTLGSIFGTVEDSLSGGVPLTEATIAVTQLPKRSAMTTASGAFRIDSLPPGKYTLEVLHPLLDSLGIRVISDTIVVTAGGLQTTLMSVPSAMTLSTTLCAPLKRKLGPVVMVGQVFDAVTGAPAAGAEVSAAWVETEASVETGIHSVPNVRKTIVASDGTYRLCGLPNNFAGSIQAIRGRAQTAEVRIEGSDQPLLVRSLLLPPPDDSMVRDSMTIRVPALRHGPARVTGIVTNNGGVPLAGAFVTVQGGASTAKTALDGTFTLTGVPLGTQAILVRRVGFSPMERPLDITMNGPNTMAFRLTEYHPQLEPVEVKAKITDELQRVGFERRRKRGQGHYLTEDDIDKAQAAYTSDLLRRLAGLRVLGSGTGLSVTTSRGNGCVNYLVDRNTVDPDNKLSIDEVVNPRDVAAIEFYQPIDIPAEFETGRNSGCGLVVIWTRTKLKDLPPKH